MSKAVFSFGRMNPPTVGHEKLVNKVRAVARAHKGDPLIYLSHTHKLPKDPLEYNDKIKLAKKAFGRIVKMSRANTIIKVLQELEKKYDEVVLVVGSYSLGGWLADVYYYLYDYKSISIMNVVSFKTII